MGRNGEGGWYEQNKHIFPLCENENSAGGFLSRKQEINPDFPAKWVPAIQGKYQLLNFKKFLVSQQKVSQSWRSSAIFWYSLINAWHQPMLFADFGSWNMLLTNPFHNNCINELLSNKIKELWDWSSSAHLCKFYVRPSSSDPSCSPQISQ